MTDTQMTLTNEEKIFVSTSDSVIEEINIDDVEHEFKPLKSLPGFSLSQPIFKLRNDKTGHILKGDTRFGYTRFTVKKNGKEVRLYLHMIIAMEYLGFDYEKRNGLVIDHINRNTSDNSVENLRIVTHSENNKNRSPFTERPPEYIQQLPAGIKYKLISFKGIIIPDFYIRIENEIYKKISDNKYLHLAKKKKDNSVIINRGKNLYRALTFTPNSKDLIVEQMLE
jgi:hypothetical protein